MRGRSRGSTEVRRISDEGAVIPPASHSPVVSGRNARMHLQKIRMHLQKCLLTVSRSITRCGSIQEVH
jgi:hypothetical protein